jgi:hypothetical protein
VESTKNTELTLLREQVNSLEKREARQVLIFPLLSLASLIEQSLQMDVCIMNKLQP